MVIFKIVSVYVCVETRMYDNNSKLAYKRANKRMRETESEA